MEYRIRIVAYIYMGDMRYRYLIEKKRYLLIKQWFWWSTIEKHDKFSDIKMVRDAAKITLSGYTQNLEDLLGVMQS